MSSGYFSVMDCPMDRDAPFRSLGAGRFVCAVLRPVVVIRTGDDIDQATRLHHQAHQYCFIANAMNFPITCEPVVRFVSHDC